MLLSRFLETKPKIQPLAKVKTLDRPEDCRQSLLSSGQRYVDFSVERYNCSLTDNGQCPCAAQCQALVKHQWGLTAQ